MKTENNEYHRTYLKRRYAERWQLSVALLGGKCTRCGSINDLQFDHIRPETKNFTITDRLAQYTWPKIEKELKKCQLLCAPCHEAKSARETGGYTNHGTLTMYKHHRCRCAQCRAANANYKAQYIANRADLAGGASERIEHRPE